MRKSVALFFLVFFGTFAVLHFLTARFLSDGFTFFPVTIGLVFTLGFFVTPLGYYIASRHPHSRFYFLAWAGYIWMGASFIAMWVSAMMGLISWLAPEEESWHLIACGLVVVLVAYSLFRGLQTPKVSLEAIKGPGSLKGLKFVQITDLHVGLLNHDERWLQRIVDVINDLNPDFVFLTGDLVEGKFAHVSRMLAPLAGVKSKLGRVYVSGNHELIHGGLVWEKELASHGWKVLHNENQVFTYLGRKILVGGVPDRMIGRFDGTFESNPDKALTSVEDLDYKILLAHEPSSVFDLKTQKPDLILAGHTHGGQIFPFGWIVRLVQPVVAGWKTILGIPVYAHEGTGLWGPPMRLGSRNRIVLFEFV